MKALTAVGMLALVVVLALKAAYRFTHEAMG